MKGRHTALIVGMALIAGYSAGHFWTPTETVKVTAGSSIFSVSDDKVRYLAFTSKAWTFTAQRSHDGRPFSVQVTFADGRPPQQCSAPADLNGMLANFTELVAKRQLSHPDQSLKEYPSDVGFLDVREADGEPQGPMLVAGNAAGNSLALKTYAYAAEVTLPVSIIKTLERGCAAVSKEVPNK